MARAATASLCAVALAACGGEKGAEGKPAGGGAAAGGADPAEVFLAGITAFNESDQAGVREAYTPNAAWWNPTTSRGPAHGMREIVMALRAFKGFIPDSRIGVRQVLRRGNMLVAQAAITGTRRWNDHGTEEAPKRIGFEVVYFVLAEGGRAKETLVYFDHIVPRRQIGVIAGDVAPVPQLPKGPPPIVGAPGAKGGVEKALAALAALGAGGAGLDQLVAPGFTYVDTSTGKRLPAAEVAAFLAAKYPATTGLAFAEQQSFAAGEFVAVRWEAKGRFAGEGDLPPKDLVLHGASVFTLAGDRIAKIETYSSDMEFLERTGLLARSARGEDGALGPRGAVAGEADAGPAAAAPGKATGQE